MTIRSDDAYLVLFSKKGAETARPRVGRKREYLSVVVAAIVARLGLALGYGDALAAVAAAIVARLGLALGYGDALAAVAAAVVARLGLALGYRDALAAVAAAVIARPRLPPCR